MHTGCLTFRVARLLGATGFAVLRRLAFLLFVVALFLPLARAALVWYVRGTFDPVPPTERSAAAMRGLAVSAESTSEADAVRGAAANLRYRFDPHAVAVVVTNRGPAGAQGEFLPFLNLIRVQRSVVRLGRIPLQWTLAHEIGHYVDDRFMTDPARARFRSLRRIPPSLTWQAPSAEWSRRPNEDFAEVFATLAVPSAVIPPATAYGRVANAPALVTLLRRTGIVFGAPPRLVTLDYAAKRQVEQLRGALSEPLLAAPVLALVATYLLVGALPYAVTSWRSSIDAEGVPHESH